MGIARSILRAFMQWNLPTSLINFYSFMKRVYSFFRSLLTDGTSYLSMYLSLIREWSTHDGVHIRDVEAAISSTACASTPVASASTNKKRENDRWPIQWASCTMTWPSMKNAMDASYAFTRSLALLISHFHSDIVTAGIAYRLYGLKPRASNPRGPPTNCGTKCSQWPVYDHLD